MFQTLNRSFYSISRLNIRNFCSDLKNKYFTDKHDWITVDKNIGTVGISEYAQEKLGDIVYVQLPELGSKLLQDDECGIVESVKAASEIFSPVSGEVIEVNKRLEQESNLLNKKPYTDGWVFKIAISKPDELKSLMDEKAYKLFLQEN